MLLISLVRGVLGFPRDVIFYVPQLGSSKLFRERSGFEKVYYPRLNADATEENGDELMSNLACLDLF